MMAGLVVVLVVERDRDREREREKKNLARRAFAVQFVGVARPKPKVDD